MSKMGMFLSENTHVGYNDELKKEFGRLAMASAKEVQKKLALKPHRLEWNKAGIAVSGEITLHGMRTDGRGIYIQYSCGGFGNGVLVRTVRDMKDYHGGTNHYVRPCDNLEERIVSLAESLLEGRLS